MSASPFAGAVVSGDAPHLAAIGHEFSALAHAASTIGHTVSNHRQELTKSWQSHAEELPHLQMDAAASQLHTAHHNLGQAAGILHRHARALAGAQADHAAASSTVTTMQSLTLANPLDPTLHQDLQRAQSKLQQASDAGQASRARIVHELNSLRPPTLAVTPHGRLDPGTALLLDSAVAHHKLSHSRAVKAGGRLGSMPAKDQVSVNRTLQGTASSGDANRIFGLLAAGKSAKQIEQKFGSARTAHAAGGGQVGAWIAAAMQVTGVPARWASPLRTLVMRESGGDPGNVNRSDSNAAAGHPSIGLAQVIQPTFDRYAARGHHQIRNPVDNVAAAINYIKATYGDISRVQQANPHLPPKGY